jgi:hypothetical protein
MCHRPSSRVRTRSSSKPPNVACGTTEKRRRTSLMSVVWNIPLLELRLTGHDPTATLAAKFAVMHRLAMVRGSPSSCDSGHDWRLKFCAEPSVPMYRSSNLRTSSWSSISRPRGRSALKFPHGARIARRQDNRMMDFLLRCMSPQLAHRVISRQRSISVAFGAKRT